MNLNLKESKENREEKKIENIATILKCFNFGKLSTQGKEKFIKRMFSVYFDEIELNKDRHWIAELISIRMEQQNACPECLGFGCETCHDTGKKRI